MVGVVLFSNGIIFLVQAKSVGEEQDERQKTRAPAIKKGEKGNKAAHNSLILLIL